MAGNGPTRVAPAMAIIGVGDAGCRAVDRLVDREIDATLVAASTDAQELGQVRLPTRGKIRLEPVASATEPGQHSIGRAVQERSDEIEDAMGWVDLAFVAAGMGDRTGANAAAELVRMARYRGAFTVAVVTRPFRYEGSERLRRAVAGISTLREAADCLLVISQDQLQKSVAQDTPILNALRAAEDAIPDAIKAVADLAAARYRACGRLRELRVILRGEGLGLMGVGSACGADRARQAAQRALVSPLLEGLPIASAAGVLVSVAAGYGLSKEEVRATAEVVGNAARTAPVAYAGLIDPLLRDALRVTVIGAGFPRELLWSWAAAEAIASRPTLSTDATVPIAQPRRFANR